jgi:acyl-CoA reductase-like NAD-dependent aldehyde dehydrogenase
LIAAADHLLPVGEEKVATGEWLEVRSPYDGRPLGRVAVAAPELVDRAVEAAGAAFDAAEFPQYERAAALDRAAGIVSERRQELAATIAAEAGKPLKSARLEVGRCVETLRFSAVEARKLSGEMVPMEASAAGAGKLGFVLHVPRGVVAAISPFNFPLNLVAHKLGPALAAGNAVVLKPAEQCPISALQLVAILLEAGVPPGWVNVLCGSGPEVGKTLVEHPRVAAVSFTGSPAVGWAIRAAVPDKKVSLELGSNAPLIVHADGDWETAADSAAAHAFSHAGQSCVSVQRILVHEDLAAPFEARFVAATEGLRIGDPMDEETDVGPLISPGEQERVLEWVAEAKSLGGRVLSGGRLVDGGRCLAPTIVSESAASAKVWREEVFGPVAVMRRYRSFEDAMAMANDARFGLQAGLFTRDLGLALRACRALEFGGVLINNVPTFRVDNQPYGGLKDSGNAREGPAFAIRELTEQRFVSLSA